MYQTEREKPYQDQAASDERFEEKTAEARSAMWDDLMDEDGADKIINHWVADERETLAKLVAIIAKAEHKEWNARLLAFREAADFIESELEEEVIKRANKLMEGE